MPTFTRDKPVDTTAPRRHRVGKDRTKARWVAGSALALILVIFVAGGIRQAIDTPAPTDPVVAAAPDPAQGQDGKGPDPAPTAAADGVVVPSCGGWAEPSTDLPDLITMPTDTTWTLVGGMAAPSSPDTGPKVTTPIRSCYNRTPAGALFGAANYLAQMQAPDASPKTETDLALTAMANTPSRDALLNQWANPGPITPLPPGAVDLRAAFNAFHFVSYTNTEALIDIAAAWNGKLRATIYTMRYENGSWLMVAPEGANGRWAQRELPVQDKNYWTPWSAQ